MLNTIWPIFIIISFIYGIFTGRVSQINDSIFSSAKDAVNLCITLFGTLCLWNGIMQIASNTKIIEWLKKMINPIMKKLFPSINKNDKVYTEMSMNMVANVMGLGNAATPLGLKAMKSLQESNPKKDTISDSMFMFIVVNTASLQIIPTTVIAIRSSLRFSKSNRNDGSRMDCNYLCFCSSNHICQNYNKKRKEKEMALINYLSMLSIPLVILVIVIVGFCEKKKTFDIFIEGAKEGIEIVTNIFPTLIGLFIAIGALRASGVLNLIVKLMAPILNLLKIPSEIMPLALLRPISGSASMAVGIDIMKTYGVDTKIGMIISTIMGSTETTLYTIAIYTSIVNIKKTRGVLKAALIGDVIGMTTAVVFWQFLS